MSAYVFCVRHRTVDLVGMTATHALRERMGLGQQLVELRRDDVFAVEGEELGAGAAWAEACLAQAHWFNPNKHRYGLYEAREGALAVAAAQSDEWPVNWLGKLVRTDRPDLDGRTNVAGLESWLAFDSIAGAHAAAMCAWDLEEGLGALPEGSWPTTEARLLRGQLWSAQLIAENEDHARAVLEGFAVTTARDQGLLVHPHMEGWASLG